MTTFTSDEIRKQVKTEKATRRLEVSSTAHPPLSLKQSKDTGKWATSKIEAGRIKQHAVAFELKD